MKYLISLPLFIIFLLCQPLNAGEYKTLTLNNVEQVFDSKENNLFINPFHKNRLFYLSFQNESNINNDVFNVTTTKMHSLISLYYNNKSFFVTHIKEEDNYFNIFNFILNSPTHDMLIKLSNEYEPIKEYRPIIWFFHEIYHLKESNFDENYIFGEARADLFAAVTLYYINDLNKKNLLEIFESLFLLRIKKIDIKIQQDDELKKAYTDYYIKKVSNIIKTIDKEKTKTFNDIARLIEFS